MFSWAIVRINHYVELVKTTLKCIFWLQIGQEGTLIHIALLPPTLEKLKGHIALGVSVHPNIF